MYIMGHLQGYTVHPKEIVPRQEPPSVDHEESDRKVNQRFVHSFSRISEKPSTYIS